MSSSKGKAFLFSGGDLDLDFARKLLDREQPEIILAADAGCQRARDLGLSLDYAVGDFDTLGVSRISQVCDAHTQVLAMKPEKDETDTEAACSLALTLDLKEIWILGALGGRMDHALANIYLLEVFLQNGISAFLVDRQNKIYMTNGERKITKDPFYGQYFSFLPYTEEVLGVSLEGFLYPLKDRNISAHEHQSMGVSNEFLGEQGTVRIKKGILLLVESRD